MAGDTDVIGRYEIARIESEAAVAISVLSNHMAPPSKKKQTDQNREETERHEDARGYQPRDVGRSRRGRPCKHVRRGAHRFAHDLALGVAPAAEPNGWDGTVT